MSTMCLTQREHRGQTVPMLNRFGLAVCVVVSLGLSGCGGSSSTSDSTSTTRLTVLPDTTAPSFEPTESTIEAVVEPTTPPAASVDETTTTITTLPSVNTDPPAADTTTTTTTTAPILDELQLSSTGIGGAQFGAEPDGVVMYMSSFLGEPTDDTGYVDPFSIGPCAGTELRLVSWGALMLTFGDVSRVVQGQRHFFAYSYGIEGQPGAAPLGLATEAGITVGSSLVDLLVAFPNLVINPADEFTPPNFFVNDDLRGYLTGLADDSTVSVILGGLGCTG